LTLFAAASLKVTSVLVAVAVSFIGLPPFALLCWFLRVEIISFPE
jgi:hypothetical protein